MNDNQAYIMEKLYALIEEETRRRFQQPQYQRQQQQQFMRPIQSNDPLSFENPTWSQSVQEIAVPGFTYQFPVGNVNTAPPGEPIRFAVSPDDPRFYAPSEMDPSGQQQTASNFNNDYQKMTGEKYYESYPGNLAVAPSSKIKAPMEVHPKVSMNGGAIPNRDDSKESVINNGQYLQRSDVIKKHLDLNTVDIYVVAVIAGVSATLTVGLIAIGIAWYT